jgi:type I restriction enzyme S subunit
MTFELTEFRTGDFVQVTDYVANGSFASLKKNVSYLDESDPTRHAVLVRTLDFNRGWAGDYVWINEEAYNFLSKSQLSRGDLVLCNVGSVGIVFEVPELNVPMSLGPNAVVCKSNDSEVIRQKFLYYYFLSPRGQALLEELSGGSTVQPKFNKTLLRNSTLHVPDVAHQDFIIELLGGLDAKIANNKSLTKTLESVAKEIFEAWFIDFGPVKAKMEGQKPIAMSDEVAGLFPVELEETPLGAVPKDWEIALLGSHITVTKGKSYKSSELTDSETALVTLKSFMRGGGYRFDGLKAFSGPYKEEQIIKPGELIVAFTDVTQAADVIGKPAIVLQNPKFSTLVASLDLGIVRTTSNRLGKFFLYNLLSTPRFKGHVEGYTNGTTVLHLGKGALETFEFALPRQEIMEKFEEIATPLWSQVQDLYLQNLVLEALRDALLPRLMSGELRIPEEMLAS